MVNSACQGWACEAGRPLTICLAALVPLMEDNQNTRYVSERLNIELLAMLSKMDSLARQVIDEIGPPLVESLTSEFNGSGHAHDYFDEDGAWTPMAHHEARLLLLQAALWLAEQLGDDHKRNRLYRECANTDLLTVYLNAKELDSIEVAA